jgi:hypothetical protein
MKVSASKYAVPEWLAKKEVVQEAYNRWLSRKAKAHVKRDRKRKTPATIEEYKHAIHGAVQSCQGLDAYTGEDLRWDLLGRYNNEASKSGRSKYKAEFGLLPTVDHAGSGDSVADFKICAWRTNDAKCDLSYEKFVELCQLVLKHHDKKSAGSA